MRFVECEIPGHLPSHWSAEVLPLVGVLVDGGHGSHDS